MLAPGLPLASGVSEPQDQVYRSTCPHPSKLSAVSALPHPLRKGQVRVQHVSGPVRDVSPPLKCGKDIQNERIRGGTHNRSIMVVYMAPAKTDTIVAVLGSLCDYVEDPADTKSPTTITVAR